MLNVSQSVKIS